MTRLPVSLFLLALLLGGCTAISALEDASRPLEIYELRTPPAGSLTARPRDIELVVEEPYSSGALATERIMIRPGPLRAQYLPGVRWADPAPAMVQTLLLRSLAETGAFGSVGRRPVGTTADFAILSELTDFQAETSTGRDGATIAVRLMVRILRERDSRVVATRTFSVSESAAATDPDTVAAAFDAAARRMMADIVPWVLSRSGASP